MSSLRRDKFVLIEGIDSSLKLSEVVEELSPEMTSIVSIYRIFDYVRHLGSEQILLTLLDDGEYHAAVAARDEINKHNDFTIDFPDLIAGSARFPTNFVDMDENRFAIEPKPMYVYDLPKNHVNTSLYLVKLLHTIESVANVTGIKWNLDYNANATRNFGFAMLDDKQAVLRLAGQRIMVNRDSIRFNTCNSACIIVHSSQMYLFNDIHKAVLTPRLSHANWLHTNVLISSDRKPVEQETIKVTIKNKPAPLKVTQSAPIMELRDDTLIINADDNDLAVSDGELAPNLAKVPVEAIVTHAEPEPIARTSSAREIDLQSRPTVKTIASKTVPIGVSRFIKMKMKGSYPFIVFHRRVMRFISNFEDIAYFDKEESATAYIAFKDVKTAAKFKQCMEALVKDSDTTFTYEEEKGISVIRKVKDKRRRPKEDTEIIYHIDSSKQMKRCMEGCTYTSFALPPDNVPK